MNKIKKLLDAYAFPGFRPLAIVKGKFGDNKARIVQLIRRQKKLPAVFAERFIKVFTTGRSDWSGICLAATPGSIYRWRRGGLTV